jgi:hypothetical protein
MHHLSQRAREQVTIWAERRLLRETRNVRRAEPPRGFCDAIRDEIFCGAEPIVGLGIGRIPVVLLGAQVDIDIVPLERLQDRIVSLQPLQQRLRAERGRRRRERLGIGKDRRAALCFPRRTRKIAC